jgi:hypothetical protein
MVMAMAVSEAGAAGREGAAQRDVLDVNPSRVHGDVVGESGIERMCMCEETLPDITPRNGEGNE